MVPHPGLMKTVFRNQVASLAFAYGAKQCGDDRVQSKLLHQAGGQRTFAVVLQSGDEVMRCLGEFANRESISAPQITAIGALQGAQLAYFDWDKKQVLTH